MSIVQLERENLTSPPPGSPRGPLPHPILSSHHYPEILPMLTLSCNF